MNQIIIFLMINGREIIKILLPSEAPVTEFRHQEKVVHASYDDMHTICQSFCCVDITQKHSDGTLLEKDIVVWHT